MEYSPERIREVFEFFLFRWEADRSRVRCLTDARCFSVSLAGFVSVAEDRDMVWISPNLNESVQDAESIIIFQLKDVVGVSHMEASEASPEQAKAIAGQIERGIRFKFTSGEVLYIYELSESTRI
jgi:hypothetical protein